MIIISMLLAHILYCLISLSTLMENNCHVQKACVQKQIEVFNPSIQKAEYL
jgi:hypothetical protein